MFVLKHSLWTLSSTIRGNYGKRIWKTKNAYLSGDNVLAIVGESTSGDRLLGGVDDVRLSVAALVVQHEYTSVGGGDWNLKHKEQDQMRSHQLTPKDRWDCRCRDHSGGRHCSTRSGQALVRVSPKEIAIGWVNSLDLSNCGWEIESWDIVPLQCPGNWDGESAKVINQTCHRSVWHCQEKNAKYNSNNNSKVWARAHDHGQRSISTRKYICMCS